ncbi:MAG: hypothetical protein ACI4XP_00410 [Acutalibacteraceae bacterium]
MSDNKSKRKYIVVAIVAALLLVGGTITAVCIANSNNNAVQVAEQSTESSIQSSVTESSTESTTTESSIVSENSTKENSATAETSKTAQESSNTSSKAETSKTETSTKSETSKTETSKTESSTPQQNQKPTSNNTTTNKPSNNTQPTTNNNTTNKPSTNTQPTTNNNKTNKPSTNTQPTTNNNTTNKPSNNAQTTTNSTSNNDQIHKTVNYPVAEKQFDKDKIESFEFCCTTLRMSKGDSTTIYTDLLLDIQSFDRTFQYNKFCKWTSNNSSVVSVDEYGNIKAKSKGSAVITATIPGSKFKASCTIFVDMPQLCTVSQKPPANAPVVKDSYGNSVYECPEIVEVVNAYRKAEGLNPLVWCDNEADYKFFYEDNEDWEIEYMKEDAPELFDENGKYIPDVTRGIGYMATRNAIHYMIENHTIGHSRNYEDDASIQIGGGSSYNPEAWVEAAMDNRGSYNQLMHPDARSIYCCYGVNAEGGYVIAM